jgi:hypothetical protein
MEGLCAFRTPSKLQLDSDLLPRYELLFIVFGANDLYKCARAPHSPPFFPSIRNSRQRRHRVAGDVDLAFSLSCLGDVLPVLHAQESVHRDAEGFFEAQSHLVGKGVVLVEEGGRGR